MSNDNNKKNIELYQLDYVGDQNSEAPQQQQQNGCDLNQEKIDKPTGVVVKNCESESLKNILIYDSSSDEDDDSSSTSTTESETEISSNLWRSKPNSSSSSSSSSSSLDTDDDDTDDDDVVIIENNDSTPPVEQQGHSNGAIKRGTTRKKQKDDLDIDDLPPVPDLSTLNINVENEKFILMGHIYGIVDRLVTVAALPSMPAYDLDTLFFLDNGKKPLGLVFDVLGQVTSPIYAIRFNNLDDIKNLNIKIGLEVFVAPTSQHTQYVFLQQLLKMKGSDASWLDDREVPSEFVDYSDDESEFYQFTKGARLNFHTKRSLDNATTTNTTTTGTTGTFTKDGSGGTNVDDSSGSSDAYKKYETTMNKRNLLNTKLNRYIDTYKQKTTTRRQLNMKMNHQNSATAIRQIHFDPTIPPPNLQPFFGFSTNSLNHSITNSNNNNNNNVSYNSDGAGSLWQQQQQQQQPNYLNFVPSPINYFAMPPPPPPPITTATTTTTTTTNINNSHECPGPSYK